MKTKIIIGIMLVFLTLNMFAQIALIGNWNTSLNSVQKQQILNDINFTNSIDISKVVILVSPDGKAKMFAPVIWSNSLTATEANQVISDIGFTNFFVPQGSKISIIIASSGLVSVHWDAM